MEALAVMIDWRIFSSFFAFLQPPLFADIHIPSFGWSVCWCWPGGAFLQPIWQTWWNTSSMPLSFTVFVQANCHSECTVPGTSCYTMDFHIGYGISFMCATELSVYYWMKPYFVICYKKSNIFFVSFYSVRPILLSLPHVRTCKIKKVRK